ncbi:hypothetical protein BJY01DRAFT_253704 [Aspergillus pseudoustus]|uniref:Zn(2)-C6 fungal-type domain-containing protein n=1 Tax=Aspergillus pseudoustus TaxID=1810923 RepID=A0ABR4IYA6_9EURO
MRTRSMGPAVDDVDMADAPNEANQTQTDNNNNNKKKKKANKKTDRRKKVASKGTAGSAVAKRASAARATASRIGRTTRSRRGNMQLNPGISNDQTRRPTVGSDMTKTASAVRPAPSGGGRTTRSGRGNTQLNPGLPNERTRTSPAVRTPQVPVPEATQSGGPTTRSRAVNRPLFESPQTTTPTKKRKIKRRVEAGADMLPPPRPATRSAVRPAVGATTRAAATVAPTTVPTVSAPAVAPAAGGLTTPSAHPMVRRAAAEGNVSTISSTPGLVGGDSRSAPPLPNTPGGKGGDSDDSDDSDGDSDSDESSALFVSADDFSSDEQSDEENEDANNTAAVAAAPNVRWNGPPQRTGTHYFANLPAVVYELPTQPQVERIVANFIRYKVLKKAGIGPQRKFNKAKHSLVALREWLDMAGLYDPSTTRMEVQFENLNKGGNIACDRCLMYGTSAPQCGILKSSNNACIRCINARMPCTFTDHHGQTTYHNGTGNMLLMKRLRPPAVTTSSPGLPLIDIYLPANVDSLVPPEGYRGENESDDGNAPGRAVTQPQHPAPALHPPPRDGGNSGPGRPPGPPHDQQPLDMPGEVAECGPTEPDFEEALVDLKKWEIMLRWEEEYTELLRAQFISRGFLDDELDWEANRPDWPEVQSDDLLEATLELARMTEERYNRQVRSNEQILEVFRRMRVTPIPRPEPVTETAADPNMGIGMVQYTDQGPLVPQTDPGTLNTYVNAPLLDDHRTQHYSQPNAHGARAPAGHNPFADSPDRAQYNGQDMHQTYIYPPIHAAHATLLPGPAARSRNVTQGRAQGLGPAEIPIDPRILQADTGQRALQSDNPTRFMLPEPNATNGGVREENTHPNQEAQQQDQDGEVDMGDADMDAIFDEFIEPDAYRGF